MKKVKKEKDKKDKVKFGTVMSDAWYAVKMIMKVSPMCFILMLFESVISQVLTFFTSTYVLRYVINSFESGLDFKTVALAVLAMLAIPMLASAIIGPIQTMFNVLMFNKLERKMKILLVEKTSSMELSCYENPEFYDKYVLASRDIPYKLWDMTWYLTNLISTIVGMILYGTLLFTMDPLFIIFAIIPLFSTFFKRKGNELWHKHSNEDTIQHRRAQYTQRIFYSADYAKEMRLTNAKEFMLERYDEASDGRMDIVRRYGFKEMLIDVTTSSLTEVISNPLAIIFAVFRTFVSKAIGIGDCAVVINSVNSLTSTFINITNRYYSIHGQALFFEDFKTFMAYEPKMKDKENALTPERGIIRLENVSFKYDGSDELVLKNVNISLGKNEKIALVGHNGAGKSTLIKLLLRLYDPTEGSVTINGIDARDCKAREYRSMFSVVFQDFKTLALPVFENVLMRPRMEGDEERVIDALKKSGVYDRIMELPNGIETMLTKEFDEDGAVLSVGESQKLAIAHAFLKNAPYVILDEPSSALDPIAESEMYSNMMKMGENKGMIFISHRLSSAVSADKIYMLENGEVIEWGTHKELMAKNGKYADMFRKQAQNYIDLEEGENE
ncbi:MAG: ABC transporter ATP-binding protein [Clostridia bacterium]|nr:ABC transporter ATP-binding protein [Clostridia bacterium]